MYRAMILRIYENNYDPNCIVIVERKTFRACDVQHACSLTSLVQLPSGVPVTIRNSIPDHHVDQYFLGKRIANDDFLPKCEPSAQRHISQDCSEESSRTSGIPFSAAVWPAKLLLVVI
ncbi:hypothetical protein TNCV_1721191 [Trichonephila clavipes]|nr:hypothetical protein TNCV_1721191 [Trichonephila clavipes]